MLYSPNIKQPWYPWDGFRIWEFRDEKWHWNVSSWVRDWFLAVNLLAWPHAYDFVLGFLGRDLPLLWTLHHWWGEISEFHLWFASGLFVKHNCLLGPEPSLDSEKVKFTLSLCSLWITLMAGVYWRPRTLGGIAQRMSRVQGWALRGKDLYVLETVEMWRQWRRIWELEKQPADRHSIIIAHMCQCHVPNLIFNLVCILTTSLTDFKWQKPTSD